MRILPGVQKCTENWCNFKKGTKICATNMPGDNFKKCKYVYFFLVNLIVIQKHAKGMSF